MTKIRDTRPEVEWECTLDDGRLLHCIYRAKIIGPDHTGRVWCESDTLNVYSEADDPERDGTELGCTDLPRGVWGRLEDEGCERLVNWFNSARDEECDCA